MSRDDCSDKKNASLVERLLASVAACRSPSTPSEGATIRTFPLDLAEEAAAALSSVPSSIPITNDTGPRATIVPTTNAARPRPDSNACEPEVISGGISGAVAAVQSATLSSEVLTLLREAAKELRFSQEAAAEHNVFLSGAGGQASLIEHFLRRYEAANASNDIHGADQKP